jgi:hypothetical protein
VLEVAAFSKRIPINILITEIKKYSITLCVLSVEDDMGVSQYDITVIYLYGGGIMFVYILTMFSISFLISNIIIDKAQCKKMLKIPKG